MAKKKYPEILIETNKREKQVRNFINHVGDSLRLKESSETQIRLDGLSDYYKMRRSWGDFLKLCLGLILVFNISLVILVGFEKLNYKDDWFLRLVLTTNLADIIGLVYLVVNFLFSNQPDTDNKKQQLLV